MTTNHEDLCREVIVYPRSHGKSVFMEKMLNDYLSKNPNATVARCSLKETIIEKPVKGVIVND